MVNEVVIHIKKCQFLGIAHKARKHDQKRSIDKITIRNDYSPIDTIIINGVNSKNRELY